MHPVDDCAGARDLQEVLVGKDQERKTICREYYYGSSSRGTPVEVCSKKELTVLAAKLQQDLIDVDRECHFDSSGVGAAVQEHLSPMVARVKSLKHSVSSLKDDDDNNDGVGDHDAPADMDALSV